ncbi:MAG: signal peptidase I [Anaerohalosphaeraceae bacterium]
MEEQYRTTEISVIPKPHNPLSALLLSLALPGLGQFYINNYRGGLLFLGLYFGLILLIVGGLACSMPIFFLLIMLILVEILPRIISSIAAFLTAKQYNNSITLPVACKGILSGFVSWLVPGLGHFILHKRKTGLIYFSLFLLSEFISFRNDRIDIFITMLQLNASIDAYLVYFGYEKRTKIFTKVFLCFICYYGIAFGIALSIKYLIIEACHIQSESMEPTLWAGDRVFSNRIYYKFHNPKQGDIVTFLQLSQNGKHGKYVKRILAIEGQTVRFTGEKILVNEKEVTFLPNNSCDFVGFKYASNSDYIVPKDSYFMIGDNIDVCLDSRMFGPVKKDKITGKVTHRFWPLEESKVFK